MPAARAPLAPGSLEGAIGDKRLVARVVDLVYVLYVSPVLSPSELGAAGGDLAPEHEVAVTA